VTPGPPRRDHRSSSPAYDVESCTRVRRENFGDERVMAVGIDNIQLTYDLVDGITDPVNLPEPVLPNTPDQIRKATIYIAGRSHRAWTRTAQIVRTGVSTQVSLCSLSYRDRY
jgi:hypothetical protein